MEDEYWSLSGSAEYEYKDKGSRFIAVAFQCKTTADFKSSLEEIKHKYPSATHFCYAYRFGQKGTESRANDDGEPGGTAGLPILNQLLSAELSDAAIVVVRYYGGIKLGASGLIKAYKTAAAEVLRSAPKIISFPTAALTINFAYEQTKSLEMLLKKFQVFVVDQSFSDRCTFQLQIRNALLSDFQSALTTFEGITLHLS